VHTKCHADVYLYPRAAYGHKRAGLHALNDFLEQFGAVLLDPRELLSLGAREGVAEVFLHQSDLWTQHFHTI